MENEEPKTYTNRELFLLIKSNNETNLLQHESILKSLQDFHCSTRVTLDELVKQTKKTNGNVMDLLLWRAFVKGQTWIIPIVVSAIISAVVGIMFINFK